MTELYKQPNSGQPLKLPVPPEFSFSQNLNYLTSAPNECLYRVHENRIYKALPIGQHIYVIEIFEDPDVPHSLMLSFIGDLVPKDTTDFEAIIRYVRDWFDLDTDLVPFYEMAEQDELLQTTIHSFYGLRNMGIPDLFEAVCWGILGQQINLAFAFTLKRRLVETYGRSVTIDNIKYYVFPEPDAIAALSVTDMEDLRMTVKKREYLIAIAHLFVEGKLSKEALLQIGDHKKIEKLLVGIRGIGPWTANYVLMRCLRIPSAFPIDDVGLHNAVKHALGSELKPSRDELLKLTAGWVNWESYSTFYMWRLLY
ncbi:DNA-3-methyladenine glycosylase [Paenibacillus sp. N3/727]|uniref:DNA-3-methyladenine glycosylase family protein n=1 Tax=Paenibacillus sp. N3/727 TaxID=2925845 RepID=UPI001F535CE8|nr:DNA-3-methyladenine glycosylase [Paenibacillus sp. N3/727]UNK16421.1 DNA-3-methyladenine glycosylase [Paenibacillus sp. N3/727]